MEKNERKTFDQEKIAVKWAGPKKIGKLDKNLFKYFKLFRFEFRWIYVSDSYI